jgi:hypothetical protein
MALWGPPTITDDEPKPVPATWFRFNRNAIVRLVNAANDANVHPILEAA